MLFRSLLLMLPNQFPLDKRKHLSHTHKRNSHERGKRKKELWIGNTRQAEQAATMFVWVSFSIKSLQNQNSPMNHDNPIHRGIASYFEKQQYQSPDSEPIILFNNIKSNASNFPSKFISSSVTSMGLYPLSFNR